MSDLIDREFIKRLGGECIARRDRETGELIAITGIDLLPSAQPMRKEAKWKTAYLDHEIMGHRPRILYCSRCNQCSAYPTDFCPACGSDMRRLI